MKLSTNNDLEAGEQARLDRDKFEMAMASQGWEPVRGLFGSITKWRCRHRTVQDKYAFDYFRASGQTPVRML